MAPDTVIVQNALAIGSEQSRQFSASLSSEFHKTIKKKVKTMELLKKAVTVKRKAIYDVVMLFSRLLVVGQQRCLDIADVFQFEMSPVPSALIDEYGCLGKGDKAVLVKCLSVSVMTACALDVVLVDAGQLLYQSPASLRDYKRPGSTLRHSTGPLPSSLKENRSVRQIRPRTYQRKGP